MLINSDFNNVVSQKLYSIIVRIIIFIIFKVHIQESKVNCHYCGSKVICCVIIIVILRWFVVLSLLCSYGVLSCLVVGWPCSTVMATWWST